MAHDRKFRFGLQLVRAESGAQVVDELDVTQRDTFGFGSTGS